MSLVSRAVVRTGVLVTATMLGATTAVVALPAVAQAADPQVCVTSNAPTAATQPWYDFAHSTNSLWQAKTRFPSLVAQATTAIAPLGPSSTQEQIDEVDDALTTLFGTWYSTVEAGASDLPELDRYQLVASLGLVDPAAADTAESEISDAYGVIVHPHYDELTDEAGAVPTFIDTLFANLEVDYPLPGPVAIPSSAAAVASLGAAAQAVDQWHDLGNARVVLGSTPTTTCAATATLTVPAATTTFGKQTTVTVSATRDGVAAHGDYAVLLDGVQIGSASGESSYVATIPASLSAGKHVLTAAFAPVDGSPLSTSSSTVTVGKARTTSTLKLSTAKTRAGKRVTATVTVAAPGIALEATGKATIKVGKKTVTVKIRNGKGTVPLRKLSAGRYRLAAHYLGSASLAASTSPKAVLIVRR